MFSYFFCEEIYSSGKRRSCTFRCFNERFSLMFVLFPVLRQERLQGVEREGVPIRKGVTAEQSSPCVLVLRTVYRKSITS